MEDVEEGKWRWKILRCSPVAFGGQILCRSLKKCGGLNGCLIRDVSKYVHLRHLPGTTFIPVKFLKIEISSAKSTATLLDVLVVCLWNILRQCASIDIKLIEGRKKNPIIQPQLLRHQNSRFKKTWPNVVIFKQTSFGFPWTNRSCCFPRHWSMRWHGQRHWDLQMPGEEITPKRWLFLGVKRQLQCFRKGEEFFQ